MWITNARHADPLPVLVKTDPTADARAPGHVACCSSTPDTPGYEVTRDIPKLGYKGTESCEIVLDDVRVPGDRAARRRRGPRHAAGARRRWSGAGSTSPPASVGIAQRAYDEALAYAQQRKAFGQPIADFQAIQLKLADARHQRPGGPADGLLGGRRGAPRAGPTRETGMAKIFCSEVALEAAIDSMKVHGGYGYSTEFEVERLYRDAILMSIGEGTNDILRTVVAKALVQRGGHALADVAGALRTSTSPATPPDKLAKALDRGRRRADRRPRGRRALPARTLPATAVARLAARPAPPPACAVWVRVNPGAPRDPDVRAPGRPPRR